MGLSDDGTPPWGQLGARVVPGATNWSPGQRVVLRMDAQLLGRLDAYCEAAQRSRASAVRHLVAVALRHYEEELDGQATRSR